MIDLSNENILHVKKGAVEYLQFKKLLEYKELMHCYTLSANEFDVAGNDDMENKKDHVLNNYEVLAKELNINYNHIIRPYQTHTNIVSSVNEVPNTIQILPKEYWEVDGLVTNKKDIVFSLSFADCTPLFMYDPIKKVIGNIHSGWKGTLNKIGKNAVNKMVQDYGCDPKDIICCIGPTIRKCHFEVDEDVYKMFYKEFLYTGHIDDIIARDSKKDKYYIDTVLINKLMLKEAELREENIIDSGICTRCNSELMHSYRAKGKNAGRNTAIMSLI